MAKSSSSGETKAPIVIALVFFVLCTIGLGVFAYMTHEDLTAAKSAAAEAALKAALPPGSWTDQRSESTVGTATVVTHVYRVGNADAAMATRLAGLRLDSSGRGFSACARSAPAR